MAASPYCIFLWETTICISQKWFNNTTDSIYKTPAELLQLYKKATAQDNIFILNIPPDRTGKLREKGYTIGTGFKKTNS